LSFPGKVHDELALSTVVFSAAGGLFDDSDNFKIATLGIGGQLCDLPLTGLVGRADPCIKCYALYHKPSEK
jgi:hypothetical protein